MLPGVLLHVIEPAVPVDVPADAAILLQLPIDDVGHIAVRIVKDVEDLGIADRTRVERLTAGGRVERGSVQDDSPSIAVSSDVANDGVEFDQVGVRVIKAVFSHGCLNQRVGNACFLKALGAQDTAVALSARRAMRERIVATVGQAVIEAQRQTAADDLRLRQRDQRSTNVKAAAVDARFRGQSRHPLERLDVLGPAVWIAGVVQRIDADEEVAGAQHFSPRQRQRQEHRIARGHVRGWNDAGVAAPLGISPSPTSADPPTDPRSTDSSMRLHAERLCHPPRRQNLLRVPLAVLHGERVQLEPKFPRDGRGRKGVQASAQQHDGFSS